MQIISRAAWGARSPRSVNTTTWARRTEFLVHYSGATPTQTVRSIQNYCMDNKGYSDIDYNALVDTAGRIYEGRTGIWLTVGSHTYNHNTSGIGVCYIGDNSTPLTEPAKRAIRWLYDEANRRRRAAGVAGSLSMRVHSDFGSTSCPGNDVRVWVKAGMPATAPAGEGDDMFAAYGDKGPRVEAYQRLLVAAGASLPRFGPDADWGDETTAAGKSLGLGDGRIYGPAEYAALQVKLAQRHAGKDGAPGSPGKEGPAGPPGEPGDAAVLAPGATLQVVTTPIN